MTGLRRAATLAVLALAALAPPASAALDFPADQWHGLPGLNHPSGAQWVRAFAHSGIPPTTVYAGLEGGGVFRSVTGGATWSAFNAGFPNPLATNVRALLANAAGTEVLAGADTGVWKSTGGGAWQPLGQGAGPGRLNGSVQALYQLPGGVLLAGVASGGVWRSGDGGATWTPPAPGNGMPSSDTPYGFVGQPPLAPAFVLATTHNGVYRSTDGGASWTLASDGIPSAASPIQAWISPQRPDLVFVSTASNGIYRSVNGGITYAPINDGLGAVRARGFQIFTGDQGANLYAATEDGLWQALQTHDVPYAAPRWREVTKDGLFQSGSYNTIMWALTAPVIPSQGSPGLMAGTQSNGGYFLAFTPPRTSCDESNPRDTDFDCPRAGDLTPVVGQTLTASEGRWDGTETIDLAYQWQQCTSSAGGCRDIADAEERTFVVPPDLTGQHLRVEVTATNPAPTFGGVVQPSQISTNAVTNPRNFPGWNQTYTPSISVNAPGQTTGPRVGDTMFAEYGTTPSMPTHDGWFNPPADSYAYQWLRCDGSGARCDEIPGATGRSYALTAADGTHDLKVRVTGTESTGGRRAIESTPSYDVTSLPAAVADPLPDPDGGPPKSQAPTLAGSAWVGHTLAGTVGGWKDPTTEFARRWVRCDPFGAACTYIQRVASIAPETGSTYVVRADDLGYTLRMRVRADVNGDLGDNGLDNLLPNAVEVDTAPSAVVTLPPGGGGGGPGGGGPADATSPTVSGLRAQPRRFAVAARPTAVTAAARRRGRRRSGRRGPPKGTTFRFTLSERATALVAIDRLQPGRSARGRCRRPSRANRRGRRCTRAVRAGTLTRRDLSPGRAAVAFSGRIGRRKLARGSYRATVVATDAAGNRSRAASTRFTVVRP